MRTGYKYIGMLLIIIFATSCENETAAEKLDRANILLSTRAGDAFARAEALGLYRKLRFSNADAATVRQANFGVGIIGFIDILHTVASLTNTDSTNSTDDGDEAALPQGSALVPIISTLVDVLLDDGNIPPWLDLVDETEFSFVFEPESLVIPAFSADSDPIDLSGEWDLTEIRIIYGILKNVLVAFDYIELYDLVLETVIDAALSDAELPDVPANPGEFPDWIVEVAGLAGLDPLPWLVPEFGVMQDTLPLTDMRTRASDGFEKIVSGLEYLDNEDDDQDDDVFPKDEFIKQLLVRIAGVDGDDITLVAIDPLVTTSLLIELFTGIKNSLGTDATVFIPSNDVWNLIDVGIDLGVPDYEGPTDPVGLRVPALNISQIFSNPVLDIKNSSTGLLPYFDSTGQFVSASEQEPFDDLNDNGVIEDGEFDDVGIEVATGTVFAGDGIWQEKIALRAGDLSLQSGDTTAVLPPIAHPHPDSTLGTEQPNGIVDPVYTFFVNADINGLFVPVTTDVSGGYIAQPTRKYENPDLMRFVSSLIWIVDSVESTD